jgi:2-keto-myo-inositol isomerase
VPQNVQLSLNRIAKPQLPLPEFLSLTRELGMKYAEVRNDFAEKGVLDGLSDAELKKALADSGVQILTINALYPFERGQSLTANLEKLKGMIADARRVGCPHIVMCPFNEQGDTRTPAQRADELLAALNAYGPLFTQAGMVGLVEPLGFERSALRTKRAAVDAIRKCAFPKAYALVHDTFHHYLSGETEFFPAETGLVHVSGVAKGKPKSAIQDDDDRILVDASDAMDNRGQLATLLKGGCKAVVSYEPFGPSIRAMPVPELKKALLESVKYLLA